MDYYLQHIEHWMSARQIMANIERMQDQLDQYVFFMNILDTKLNYFVVHYVKIYQH